MYVYRPPRRQRSKTRICSEERTESERDGAMAFTDYKHARRIWRSFRGGGAGVGMRGGLAQSVKGREGGLGLYTSIEDVFDVEGNRGFTHAVLGERPNRVE